VKDYFRRIEQKSIDPEKLDKVPLYKPMRVEALPDPYTDLIGLETLEMVRKLARRTAEMHLALFWDKTDLAFSPAQYSEDYKVWLLNRLMYILDHRITTMENVMDKFSPQAKQFAVEFLDRKVEIKNRILNFDEKRLNSARIRIHGDYHLGQVIRSGDDWIILDFEGEPEATIRDRKVKQSPLKDVAGMCRSFHYAVFATIFTENSFSLPEPVLSEAGGRYYRAIVAVFLDTYLNTAYARGLNVGYASEIDFLLRYHIFEKAIYELGYELNSRPDWVIIPLKGLNQILNND
jgi:maltose alpha-D-glucosyltransferase/alpha-amylase